MVGFNLISIVVMIQINVWIDAHEVLYDSGMIPNVLLWIQHIQY